MKKALSLEEIKHAFDLMGKPEGRGIDRSCVMMMPKPRVEPYGSGLTERQYYGDRAIPVNFILEDGEWKLLFEDGQPSIYDAKAVGQGLGSNISAKFENEVADFLEE